MPLTTAEMNSNEHWYNSSSTSFFIIPGGRDQPFVQDFSGRNLDNLKKYLTTGGIYIGICAGAYVASSFIRFEEGNSPYEVIGPRWNLVPCVAVGSLFPGTFHYNYPMVGDEISAERSEQQVNVPTAIRLDHEMPSLYCTDTVSIWSDLGFLAHYNGGPHFQDIRFPCHIHAWYDMAGEMLPAVVSSTYGQGSVFLFGFHIENRAPISDLNLRVAFCRSMLLK
ncbi:hypothetical protein MDAP_001044 [Mitosporidium daphniae]